MKFQSQIMLLAVGLALGGCKPQGGNNMSPGDTNASQPVLPSTTNSGVENVNVVPPPTNTVPGLTNNPSTNDVPTNTPVSNN